MTRLEHLPITDLTSLAGHIVACVSLPVGANGCTGFWVSVMLACWVFAALVAIGIVWGYHRERYRQEHLKRMEIDKGYVNEQEIEELSKPWGDVPPEQIARNLDNPKAC